MAFFTASEIEVGQFHRRNIGPRQCFCALVFHIQYIYKILIELEEIIRFFVSKQL